jgi:hypothetical protein
VVGLLDYFVKRPGVEPDFMDSLYKALVITAILFIGELVVEIRENQLSLTASHRKFMKRNANLTGALLGAIVDELTDAVTVSEDKVVVDHKTLAILSYDTFWKLLVEKKRKGRPLTIHTIHSCAIDVWLDHPLTKSLLSRQREFCRLEGKIVRIICDRGPQAKPHVLAAAEQMASIGIEVRYYDLNSDAIDHSFAWDFAVIEETGDGAIWDSFAAAPGGVIETAVYVSGDQYKGKNLRELWARVSSMSTPLAAPAKPQKVLSMPGR